MRWRIATSLCPTAELSEGLLPPPRNDTKKENRTNGSSVRARRVASAKLPRGVAFSKNLFELGMSHAQR